MPALVYSTVALAAEILQHCSALVNSKLKCKRISQWAKAQYIGSFSLKHFAHQLVVAVVMGKQLSSERQYKYSTLRKRVPLLFMLIVTLQLPHLSQNDSDKLHWQTDIYSSITKLETLKDIYPPESLEENAAVKSQLSEKAHEINHA